MDAPNHFRKNERGFKQDALSFRYQVDQVRVIAADCSETRSKPSTFPASPQNMDRVARILIRGKPQEFFTCEQGHSQRLVAPPGVTRQGQWVIGRQDH